MNARLGEPLPQGDEHAVSVSLPTWADTEGWAKRDPEILSQLQAGYPRFYVPLIVRDLANKLFQYAAKNRVHGFEAGLSARLLSATDQSTMLFPSQRMAHDCQQYLRKCQGSHRSEEIWVLHGQISGCLAVVKRSSTASRETMNPGQDLYAVVFPNHLDSEAKAFWQHTGFGISTRFAEYWLKNASFLREESEDTLVAEKLPIQQSDEAALCIRQRIAELYSTSQTNARIDDVYLYPTGMSAIAHTAIAVMGSGNHTSQGMGVAVFGFLYVDTFKVISKVHGFDSTLYDASDSEMDKLERDLEGGKRFRAVFTEFPGNPLLASFDLDRLHTLSKKYDFALVIDDTIGTSVNLDLISLCDAACTSLTKMFSGACNVMGGSVLLNPKSSHYERLRQTLSQEYLDTYFPTDVIVMQRNSADFESRLITANGNAEFIADKLRAHGSVEEVFYPKGSITQHLYDRYKRAGGGYGFLLSIRFVKPAAAIAFYDALDVAKGPSLGTNFTLSCAYTLLAHYSELEWAAEYGVVEHLVRISVGIEDRDVLDSVICKALAAAEEHS
ncbi:hypothetical protein HIM_02812 [Hirsutella minnesotensis 3608]|nr:hypothetical protein HIM_02812 [Hirsutella minnesotensis 3608]